MELKTILMRYSVTGTSIIILLCLWQCKVEYAVNADFVFINDTNFKVNYSDLLSLLPLSSDTVFISGEGKKKSSPETCCQGFLEDFQGDFHQVYIIVDDTLCLTYQEGQGPTSLANFEKSTLTNNHFQYTYHFKQDQFDQLQPCN